MLRVLNKLQLQLPRCLSTAAIPAPKTKPPILYTGVSNVFELQHPEHS